MPSFTASLAVSHLPSPFPSLFSMQRLPFPCSVEALQGHLPSPSLSVPWEQSTETPQRNPNTWNLSLVQRKGMVKHLPSTLLSPLSFAWRRAASSYLGMCWKPSGAHSFMETPLPFSMAPRAGHPQPWEGSDSNHATGGCQSEQRWAVSATVRCNLPGGERCQK